MGTAGMKQDYPRDLVRKHLLASGQVITIRPIRTEDAGLERDFIEALSPKSSHMRFMAGIRRPSEKMVRYFTDIDYDRHMALIATTREGQCDQQIAVGRTFLLDDGQTCEFAVAVADAWQGQGIAHEIMTDLIRIARDKGLTTMVGDILAENVRMIGLVRDLGFEVSESPDDPGIVQAALNLQASEAPGAIIPLREKS